MYLVAIAWVYVAVMMAVAEAMHPSGSILGGLVTFIFYGLLPVGLVMYILNTPHRRKARARAEAEAAGALPEVSAESPAPPNASPGVDSTAGRP